MSHRVDVDVVLAALAARGYVFDHPNTVPFSTEPTCVQPGPSRSGRDINDGPIYAPDGTYACGDPDCYSCWPKGAPNTVGYSAGAVCCPDEASVRRHRDRATWWQPEHGEFDERWRFMILPAERRWTR